MAPSGIHFHTVREDLHSRTGSQVEMDNDCVCSEDTLHYELAQVAVHRPLDSFPDGANGTCDREELLLEDNISYPVHRSAAFHSPAKTNKKIVLFYVRTSAKRICSQSATI